MKRLMRVYSGRILDVDDVRPQDISVDDICHGLANTPRYNGHTDFPYSVAQHSVMLMWAARKLGMSQEMQTQCLLHDAAEAYMGDIPSPWKARWPEAQKDEVRLLEVIGEAMGVKLHPLPKQVKELDYSMRLWEAYHLFPEARQDPWGPANTDFPVMLTFEQPWGRLESRITMKQLMLQVLPEAA